MIKKLMVATTLIVVSVISLSKVTYADRDIPVHLGNLVTISDTYQNEHEEIDMESENGIYQ